MTQNPKMGQYSPKNAMIFSDHSSEKDEGKGPTNIIGNLLEKFIHHFFNVINFELVRVHVHTLKE